MSLKRCMCRMIRYFLVHWTAFAVVGFIIFLFIIRVALYTPQKQHLYHNEDEDYQDVPRHHVPHYLIHSDHQDDFDNGEPIIRADKTTTSSNELNTTKETPPFLIHGMDWKIAVWEYFTSFVHSVNDSRLILLWTPWHEDDLWSFHMRRNDGPVIRLGTPDEYGKYDDQRACYLGTDRSRLEEAAAVIFHGRALENDPDFRPDQRPANQYWVYYDIEPPRQIMATERENSLSTLINDIGFNWVWSYSHKADVPHPFGNFVQRKVPLTKTEDNSLVTRIRNQLANFTKREFDAVMMSSNCKTESRREILVAKLEKYGLKVEKVGKCHHTFHAESLLDMISPEAFYSKYRFFFAFEISRCDDYVTEKVYRAFNASKHHSVIPIVYGAGRTYEYFLPEGSYINADIFSSAKELADFLKGLRDAPVSKLQEYFMWQRHFELNQRFYRSGLHALCEKIWEVKPYPDDDDEDNDTNKKDNNVPLPRVKDVVATFGKCYGYSAKWLGLTKAEKEKL